MDSLDVKIFHAMETQHYIIPSGMKRHLNLRSMAKHLGVDSDTVRARIKKLENTFIQYYQVFPNLNVFELQCIVLGLLFSDPARKKEILQKLTSVEEVGLIDERLNSLRIYLLCRELEHDLERKLALIEKLSGVVPMQQNWMEMPPLRIQLSLPDWRIIKSLRYDARKPSEQVAKEVRLTKRAVNYRLQRLLKENAYFIVPIISFRNLENLIFNHYTCYLDENRRAETIDEITQLFGERCMSSIIGSEGCVIFCVATSDIVESEEDYLKVTAIQGVDKVISDFPLRFHDTSTYIDKRIDEKIMGLAS
jgi:DNA-binding Lrp family transcriptional regulator